MKNVRKKSVSSVIVIAIIMLSGCFLFSIINPVTAAPTPTTDGSVVTNTVSTSSPYTMAFPSMTTTTDGDVLYVSFVGSSDTIISSITSTQATSVWTQRADISYSSTHHLQTWYATWSSHGAIVVTLHVSGNGNNAAVFFAVKGANVNQPFDGTAQTATGSNSVPTKAITTTKNNDFVIGMLGVESTTSPAKGASFTLIKAEPAASSRSTSTEYQTTATAPGSVAVNYLTTSYAWGIVADAITPAVSTTTSVSLPSAIDLGQSVTITATVNPSAATGTATFGVSTNSGTSWSAPSSPSLSGGTATYSYAPSATGTTYRFNATYNGDVNYWGSTSSISSLTVNSVLVAPTVSASASMVDQSQTSSLGSTTMSTGTSPYTYQWLSKAPGAGSFSNIGSATSSSYSFATTGSTAIGTWNFELQVTDATLAVVTSNSISVVVAASPTVSISPVGPLMMDVGQIQVFTAAPIGGLGTLSYQWYLDSNAVGTNSATYSYTAAGTSHSVTCKVTDSASTHVTSPASNAVTITVSTSPIVAIAPAGSFTMDVGQTKGFTATPSGGSGTIHYQWFVGAGTVGIDSSSYTYTASGSSASITCKVTDSASVPVTSAASNAVAITVNSALTITVAPASVTMDAGQVQTFTATVGGGTGSKTYQWYLAASPVSGQIGLTYAYTASGSSASIYCTVTDAASTPNVVQSNTASVIVNPVPTVSVSPTSWAMYVGQTKQFTANPTGGSGSYSSYQWYVGGTLQNGQTSSTFSYSPSSAGSPLITVTVTDNLGVTSAQSSAPSVTVSQLTIAASAGANGVISPSGSVAVQYNAAQTFTITANIANHYHVADVLVDGSSVGAVTSYTFNSVTAAHTISASFALDTVTLTLSPGADGSIVANPASGWHYGDVVTVTANPSTGYSFGSWGGAATGSVSPTTVTMSGDKTVSATFTANNYPLTVNVDGSGLVAKTPDQTNYAFGSTVSLQANANPGYTFSGWTGDFVGTSNPYVLTIDTTPSITATFTQNTYSVTFAKSGGGSSTTSPTGTQSYTLNQAVPISVTTAPGYTFSTWSATGGTTFDSATTASTNAHIGGSGTITASFTQNEYTLPVTAAHGSVVKTPNQATYHLGDVVSLAVTADAGWAFSGWSGDLTGTANPGSVTIDATPSVTASFTQNTFAITVTQSAHGTIAPDSKSIEYGGSQSFTITPDTGYHIASVTVDGSGAVIASPYTFSNVKETHSITATYAIDTFAITVTQSAHGAITGPNSVDWGTDAVYSIAPTVGYSIVDVVVDGHSQGAVTSAAISNVKETGHSISASYALTIHATVLTISVDPKIVNKYDSPHATVCGYLKSEGTGLNLQTVTISYNDGRNGWIECGHSTTDKNGYYTVDFPVTPDFVNGFVAFEVKYAGDTSNGYAAATPVQTGAVGGESGNLNVLPEYIFGGLAALGACFVGFAVFKKRRSLPFSILRK